MTVLTIIRYRKRFILFALLAMAIHRLPLWFNKKISFYKLMGSGKNGTFDKTPDWQQWAIFSVMNDETGNLKTDLLKKLYGSFIAKWFLFFKCETWTVLLEPLEGHGSWDRKKPFGDLPRQSDYEGTIAVLTRASIRISKLNAFWKHVDGIASKMATANGFITSFGIGEMPWLKQATFSIWQNKESMKQFAYSMQEHKEVIVKTRRDKWYSEDMFTRFRIIYSSGTIKGIDPLASLNYSATFAN
ncbi:MAG: spheroidene monooxygenase [Ferruginibacter sp.]